METEKIIKVLNVKKHCYDGTQCETAIYAKSDSRPGYRWYVGYGADKMPASKSDLANMEDYINQADEMMGLDRYVGEVVIKYRS
jgi:hypothetical protein